MVLVEANIAKDANVTRGDNLPSDFSKFLNDDGFVSLNGQWYIVDLSRLSSNRIKDPEKFKVYSVISARLRKLAAAKGFKDEQDMLDTEQRYLIINLQGDSVTGRKEDYFKDSLKDVKMFIRHSLGIMVENLCSLTPENVPQISQSLSMREIIKLLAE